MEYSFWPPLRLSVEIAFVSSFMVLITGLFFGRVMANVSFKGKAAIETLFLLPLVLPPTVVGFLLIVMFGQNSPVGRLIQLVLGQSIMFTWWAAVIASTVVAFPLMYQSCKTGFQSVDRDIEHAARVDGAGEFALFLFVTAPLAIKSIVSGFLLSFARALGEFGATLMFAGNIPGKTQTASTAIYMAIDSGNMGMAWMWVGSMISISFLMLACIQLIKS
ncbi:molybdate ABC transporter permease subunit [Domibacillus sp.]|uniref:molybdate ABC transporter permease subunit n=1 Tax=Domibacillus sp. TaxID=1969783 RepID=UPI002811B72C|nr:molybdate ABC transporter permease subunit [Domibacillus sp.]